MDNLQPYSEYKDSGLPWLGKIPAQWDMQPNKAVMRKRKVLVGDRHPQFKLLSLTKSGVIIRDISTGKGKFSSDMGTSQEVRIGDLVLCLFDVPETPRTVGLSRHGGMITSAYTVMEFLVTEPARYLELFYISMDDRKLLSPLYSGLRNTIPPERFLGTKSPFPPPDEQVAIVRFLNHANLRIEKAIRAKRKVIALLNEQKQVIIHRAVTRGIEPNVKLKPSSIQWLGDIPEHWEDLRSKYVFHEVDERSVTGAETHLSMSQKYGLIPNSQIQERRLVSESYIGAKLCRAGDLVLNRLKAHLGVFALAPEPGLISPDYTVFRPARPMVARYFEAMYRTPACRVELRKRAKGIVQGFWRLYTDDFYDIRVPVPPLEEQEKIMQYLDRELSSINTVIAGTEREIDLLREYRTRLTSDVVTGKLDVRQAAARLPDEFEELDDTLTDESDELEEIESEDA